VVTNSGLTAVRYFLLSVVLIIMIFPLFWMFRVALMPVGSSVAIDSLFQSSLTFQPFRALFEGTNTLKYLFNSGFVAIVVVLGNILFCFMTAYGLARFKSIVNKPLFISVIIVLSVGA